MSADPPADDSTPEAPPVRSERAVRVQVGGCVGCLAVVLAIYGLLALTVFRSDATFVEDPEQVAALLREATGAAPPAGYRPFRGAHARGRRIVQLVPESYAGGLAPLESRLLIAVWTFRPGTSSDEAKREIEDYWPKLVAERLGQPAAEVTADGALEVELGGAALTARDRRLEGKTAPLRVVTAVAPGSPPTAFAFVGVVDGFDEPALRAFLQSVSSP